MDYELSIIKLPLIIGSLEIKLIEIDKSYWMNVPK